MIKKMMNAPCSLNVEPYLTEWHADLESGMEIWIQTSEDQEHPLWMRMGSLLEAIWFKDKNYLVTEFIDPRGRDTSLEHIVWSYKQ